MDIGIFYIFKEMRRMKIKLFNAWIGYRESLNLKWFYITPFITFGEENRQKGIYIGWLKWFIFIYRRN